VLASSGLRQAAHLIDEPRVTRVLSHLAIEAAHEQTDEIEEAASQQLRLVFVGWGDQVLVAYTETRFVQQFATAKLIAGI
jgi:hypothetical protein